MSSGDVSDIANQRRGGRPVRQLLEAKRKTSPRLSFTAFDPGCVKSRESATIAPFPDGGYGWDASLKARIDPS